MLFWHVPRFFDLADRNQFVHIWLMHGSYFIVGVLFWLQFMPSPPFRIKLSRPAQMAALLLTNVQMWLLAMAMSSDLKDLVHYLQLPHSGFYRWQL